MKLEVNKPGSTFANICHLIQPKWGNTGSRSNQQDSNVTVKTKCYEYRQFGHFKSKCLNQAAYKQYDPQCHRKENATINAFNVVFLNGQFSKEDWYVDSGTHCSY